MSKEEITWKIKDKPEKWIELDHEIGLLWDQDQFYRQNIENDPLLNVKVTLVVSENQ